MPLSDYQKHMELVYSLQFNKKIKMKHLVTQDEGKTYQISPKLTIEDFNKIPSLSIDEALKINEKLSTWEDK